MTNASKIKIDGSEYDVANLPDAARAQLDNIAFCDAQIVQLRNEWAIADTARLAYTNAIKREKVK
jgi:hypothetical protein